MSSDLMYLRLRSCLCKKAYPVETMATRMANHFRAKPGFVLRPYLCQFCHLWHVGHTRFRPPADVNWQRAA
jgi:hypothetical protein